jgi:hypothetical protein
VKLTRWRISFTLKIIEIFGCHFQRGWRLYFILPRVEKGRKNALL